MKNSLSYNERFLYDEMFKHDLMEAVMCECADRLRGRRPNVMRGVGPSCESN